MKVTMAVGRVTSRSLLVSGSCFPSSSVLRRCFLRLRDSSLANVAQSPHRRGVFAVGSRSAHSLVEFVMEELAFMRESKRIRATSKIGFLSGIELEEDEGRKTLQKGLLLEFRKDAHKVLLAVALKPDGKKNWMVCDQNGVVSSIRPQQVTYVVPGIQDFDPTEISHFAEKSQNLMDPSILEYAWLELLEKNKSMTAEELAEVLYGSKEPLQSYCAHLMLSNDDVYFHVAHCKGFDSVYIPRSSSQAEELLRRKNVKKASEEELEEFVQLLSTAKALPLCSKPLRCSWVVDEKVKEKIESIEAYAIDAYQNDERKKTAGMILKAMGLQKTSSDAMNLLIDIGYFPVHVNLDLLKYNICRKYPDEVMLAAEKLLTVSSDSDKNNRKDLTFLKVYAIDVDEADELDDALSAERLQDGRIRVWIHVADPTSWIEPRSVIDREASRRGTSIFMPTGTYPMFPEKLAMEAMSLQQGKLCRSVSISVTLHEDGSIAEYSVNNSVIRPTYMLTYESATELLHLNLEEEAELSILAEAASKRFAWRQRQGAVDTASLEPRIKVSNPDDPEPSLSLYIEDQSSPAMRLVTEMMVLCGEVVATFGSCNKIPLPYRGQPQSDISMSDFNHLPEGPVRSSALVKIMRAAEMDFTKPLRHGVLGLPGYVQFTSPIRRYLDLLAHYQIKAFLRDESLPFSAGELGGLTFSANANVKIARKLYSNNLRYWLLEYLRKAPRNGRYRAVILKFVKDRIAALLLLEVGIQATATISVGVRVGDEIEVTVEESHPRKDLLSVKEVFRDA